MLYHVFHFDGIVTQSGDCQTTETQLTLLTPPPLAVRLWQVLSLSEAPFPHLKNGNNNPNLRGQI